MSNTATVYEISYGLYYSDRLTDENCEPLTFADFESAAEFVNGLIEQDLAEEGINAGHPDYEKKFSSYWVDYTIVEATL